MKGLVGVLSLGCLFLLVQSKKADHKPSKRDDIFSPDELAEIHNLFKQNTHQTDEEVKAAFPVMNAFKSHPLLSSDDLKDKTEFDYQQDQSGIENAVQAALSKLHKKKAEYAEEVQKHVTDDTVKANKTHHKKSHVTAKELIDEVVQQEMAKHTKGRKVISNDDEPEASDESGESRSNLLENKIHHKLAEISFLEEKLFRLIRDVKGYLLKKKAELPEHHAADNINDDDNVDAMMLNKKKRSAIPHVGALEKFRKDPSLVDKYMNTILNQDDSDTEKGDQRDLLGKKDMETALLRQIVPGDIDSVPISRLDRQSEDMESMATDRGIARDALVESPFSVLDVKQTTGKKFRHTLS